MSNLISTSGLNSGTVATSHQSGQSAREWVADHDESIESDGPGGDELTTEWISINGTEKVVTQRETNESDSSFMSRHETEYLLEMLDVPPLP